MAGSKGIKSAKSKKKMLGGGEFGEQTYLG